MLFRFTLSLASVIAVASVKFQYVMCPSPATLNHEQLQILILMSPEIQVTLARQLPKDSTRYYGDNLAEIQYLDSEAFPWAITKIKRDFEREPQILADPVLIPLVDLDEAIMLPDRTSSPMEVKRLWKPIEVAGLITARSVLLMAHNPNSVLYHFIQSSITRSFTLFPGLARPTWSVGNRNGDMGWLSFIKNYVTGLFTLRGDTLTNNESEWTVGSEEDSSIVYSMSPLGNVKLVLDTRIAGQPVYRIVRMLDGEMMSSFDFEFRDIAIHFSDDFKPVATLAADQARTASTASPLVSSEPLDFQSLSERPDASSIIEYTSSQSPHGDRALVLPINFHSMLAALKDARAMVTFSEEKIGVHVSGGSAFLSKAAQWEISKIYIRNGRKVKLLVWHPTDVGRGPMQRFLLTLDMDSATEAGRQILERAGLFQEFIQSLSDPSENE